METKRSKIQKRKWARLQEGFKRRGLSDEKIAGLVNLGGHPTKCRYGHGVRNDFEDPDMMEGENAAAPPDGPNRYASYGSIIFGNRYPSADDLPRRGACVCGHEISIMRHVGAKDGTGDVHVVGRCCIASFVKGQGLKGRERVCTTAGCDARHQNYKDSRCKHCVKYQEFLSLHGHISQNQTVSSQM